jgi:transcriptional regulator with XRE-family HTH domain
VPKRQRRPSPPPPPEAKILGRRIRSLRDAREGSQDDLAEKTDFDRAYIGGVETGQRNITLRNLLKFARAFRISLSELVEGLR